MGVSARVHRVNRAVHFIEERLFGPLSAEPVAAAVGGSVFELHRLFTQVYGISLAGYIRARRLSEAARMLRDENLDILEVANRCQYGSQAAFTRAFRRQFDVPPGAWRRGEGQAYATVGPATAGELLHREGLPRLPELVWRHADTPLFGISGEIALEDTSAFVEIARSLETNLPAESTAVGLAMHPTGDALQYFAGTPDPLPCFDEQTTWPAGLYAVFTHHGPADTVRHTLAFIVQRWRNDRWLAPSSGPHAEVFQPSAIDGEMELRLWIRIQVPESA